MSPRILLVDDNQDLADNIAEILESEGYSTIVAHDPESALEAASTTSFDVALLDVRLPGMDGVSLFCELQRTHPHATYLLMTAFARDERIAEAEKAGIGAVLAKPIPIEQMLALLPPPASDLPAVLLVEDDEALANNLRELLSGHGYPVDAAATLAEARDRLAELRPSAVVVDIHLPDGDGTELAKELCRVPGLTVIVMSGYDPERTGEAVRVACGEGTSFLPKPFDVAHLLRALDGITERAALRG